MPVYPGALRFARYPGTMAPPHELAALADIEAKRLHQWPPLDCFPLNPPQSFAAEIP